MNGHKVSLWKYFAQMILSDQNILFRGISVYIDAKDVCEETFINMQSELFVQYLKIFQELFESKTL